MPGSSANFLRPLDGDDVAVVRSPLRSDGGTINGCDEVGGVGSAMMGSTASVVPSWRWAGFGTKTGSGRGCRGTAVARFIVDIASPAPTRIISGLHVANLFSFRCSLLIRREVAGATGTRKWPSPSHRLSGLPQHSRYPVSASGSSYSIVPLHKCLTGIIPRC